jgi:hypothetical protein
MNGRVPRSFGVEQIEVWLIRKHFRQLHGGSNACFGSVRIEVSGDVALVVDTPLDPAETRSREKHLGAVVIYLEKELFAFAFAFDVSLLLPFTYVLRYMQ